MKPWTLRTAADVMKSPVLSLDPDIALRDAAAWMSDQEISGAPIQDHSGQPLGVVSLFDIVTFLAGMDVPRGGFYRRSYPKFGETGDDWEKTWEEIEPDALKTTPVSEIMTPEILTVDEGTPLPQVARLMKRKHIHRIFVAREGRLVGVISTMDLLGAVSAVSRRTPVRVRV